MSNSSLFIMYKKLIKTKNKNMNKKIEIKEYMYLFIGSILIAYSTIGILLPNQLSSGGFGGIATIGFYFLRLPVGMTTLILNIPLLIISILKVGKKLAIKSVVGTIELSIILEILNNIEPMTNDKLLAAIYGGMLTGIGTALILKSGGSTGGTDLLSYIIKSYKPGIRSSSIITSTDTIIIILNIVTFKNIEIGLYSIIVIYITGKVIDIVEEQWDVYRVIIIISKRNNKIIKKIKKEFESVIKCIYLKEIYNEEEIILISIVSKKEIKRIKIMTDEEKKELFIVIFNVKVLHGVE